MVFFDVPKGFLTDGHHRFSFNSKDELGACIMVDMTVLF
jgi:hypothetical protein